jgi:DNA-binding NtrC family response regulator
VRINNRVARILVADDQKDVLEALRLLLKGEEFQPDLVSSPKAVLKAATETQYDLVLMDLNYTRDTTSGQEGLDLLAQLRAIDSTLPIVVMTAWGSVELVVEAMRRGARDFCQKPWDNNRLLTTLRTQLDLATALRRERNLEAENQLLRSQKPSHLIAQSPAMQPVLQLINRVGPSDANVLVTGENGTGKGVVARALHTASTRAAKPLVTINMGGLSEGVFESELFGHVKGAFTDAKNDRVGRFELASEGTLFLDEIANIPLAQQAKLLRVLETGEFERVGSSKTLRANVRIISATNADVQTEVSAGRFRQDLLFRLNTITIHLPPLRERLEDISALASYFLEQQRQRYRKRIEGFDKEAMDLLLTHTWPGNIRELNHVVERSVLMCSGNSIGVQDLGLQSTRPTTLQVDSMSLEEVEQHLIRKTLARFNGNVLQAAEALGLSRSAFYRRLEKYKL